MSSSSGNRQVVCRLEDIEDRTARGFEFGDATSPLGLFIVRQGEDVYAYRNSCPHTGVNLEWLPDQFLDNPAEYIQCSVHGALFRIEDGLCVRGPCAGDTLKKIPVEIHKGELICTFPESQLAP